MKLIKIQKSKVSCLILMILMFASCSSSNPGKLSNIPPETNESVPDETDAPVEPNEATDDNPDDVVATSGDKRILRLTKVHVRGGVNGVLLSKSVTEFDPENEYRPMSTVESYDTDTVNDKLTYEYDNVKRQIVKNYQGFDQINNVYGESRLSNILTYNDQNMPQSYFEKLYTRPHVIEYDDKNQPTLDCVLNNFESNNDIVFTYDKYDWWKCNVYNYDQKGNVVEIIYKDKPRTEDISSKAVITYAYQGDLVTSMKIECSFSLFNGCAVTESLGGVEAQVEGSQDYLSYAAKLHVIPPAIKPSFFLGYEYFSEDQEYEFTYDENGRIVTAELILSKNNTLKDHVDFTYDEHGNLLSIDSKYLYSTYYYYEFADGTTSGNIPENFQ